MQKIFLSYRRSISSGWVGRLAERLQKSYGPDSIFKDIDSIKPGVDFVEALDSAIDSCDVLLAIIAPNWLDTKDKKGRQRLENQKDPVRLEIVSALKRNITVIPVLVGGATMPATEELPEALHALARRQALEISDTRWDYDFNRLVKVLDEIEIDDEVQDDSNELKESIRKPKTIIGRLSDWAKKQPSYIFYFCLPPLIGATWHICRLPFPSGSFPPVIYLATAVSSLLLLFLGNRFGGSLLSAIIGSAFTLKPLIVPLVDGFGESYVFSYESETAMTYWVPGCCFLLLAALSVITTNSTRLKDDLRRLTPNAAAIVIGLMATISAYFFFSPPTVYDLYLPYQSQYASFRQKLGTIATKLDNVVPSIRLSGPLQVPLEIPLILYRGEGVRYEDPSTTGHILLYQHLKTPDEYLGDIEYAINDVLHLHLRDTGPDPVLYNEGFTKFAGDMNTSSLQQVVNAPYLVIVKPRHPDRSGQINNSNLNQVKPFWVFLYHLKNDQILLTVEIAAPGKTVYDLEEKILQTLQINCGAKIIRSFE